MRSCVRAPRRVLTTKHTHTRAPNKLAYYIMCTYFIQDIHAYTHTHTSHASNALRVCVSVRVCRDRNMHERISIMRNNKSVKRCAALRAGCVTTHERRQLGGVEEGEEGAKRTRTHV